MLDLDHRPLPVLVFEAGLLGDDPIAASRLELVKPAFGALDIVGLGGEVPGERQILEQLDESVASIGERLLSQVVAAESEKVEGHQLRRSVLRQHLYP